MNYIKSLVTITLGNLLSNSVSKLPAIIESAAAAKETLMVNKNNDIWNARVRHEEAMAKEKVKEAKLGEDFESTKKFAKKLSQILED